MKTIELFCGTKSFSKVAQELGHEIYTIDNEKIHNPDLLIDVLKLDKLEDADLVWASPPCTAFSVAAMGKNWTPDRIPKSESAFLGLRILDKTIELISKSNCKFWYIENPRGMMRVKIDEVFRKYGIKDYRRVTVTYCQYGDTRMKPTDIWTNDLGWNPKPPCKNGDTCHVSAPRGSRTGTQGLKGAIDRGMIPPDLFKEILEGK